ncbi:MAG: FaeA/PapI family transcriptional regulator [Hafnia sp.]|uniref:FaeA/PapI family transcriptional regulator n=1 Tax=Hafnia sp. TaxID=1873498 RepID=UPI002FC924C3
MKNKIYLHMSTHQAEREQWKTRDIANCFDLDVYQARYYLLHLCEEGRVKKAGTGRGAPLYWSLSDNGNNESDDANANSDADVVADA